MKNNNKRRYIVLAFLITLIIIFIYTMISSNKKTIHKHYQCKIESNYVVKLISHSNDEYFKYLTITEYQGEGIYSVRVPSEIADKLEVDKRYKFIFETNLTKDSNEVLTPDTIFRNSNIISVTESTEDEIWVNNHTCNNE